MLVDSLTKDDATTGNVALFDLMASGRLILCDEGRDGTSSPPADTQESDPGYLQEAPRHFITHLMARVRAPDPGWWCGRWW
eukprot:5660537-Pyramimonas_sp.AAC.1